MTRERIVGSTSVTHNGPLRTADWETAKKLADAVVDIDWDIYRTLHPLDREREASLHARIDVEINYTVVIYNPEDE